MSLNARLHLAPLTCGLTAVLALAAAVSFAVSFTLAQEEQANEGPAGNPYAARQGASVDELETFIQQMQRKPESIRKRAPFQDALADAGERILKAQASDKQRVLAAQTLFDALHQQAVLGDEKADARLMEWATRLAEDSQDTIAAAAKVHLLEGQLMKARAGKPDQQDVQSLFEEVKAVLLREPPTRRHLRLVSETVGLINGLSDAKLKDELFDQLGELLATSDDREVARYGKQILKKPGEPGKSAPRLADLVGKTLELDGTTVDGLPFDWASYRGKIVLVDFWATWCGPCRAELPNVKEVYAKYRDQGFEIVGISLDTDRKKLQELIEQEEIAWANLFDKDHAGWGNPLAKKYGIRAIPATLLVDREGKVVVTNARGKRLAEQVEKLLGEAADN